MKTITVTLFLFSMVTVLSCTSKHDEKYAELDDAVAHRPEYLANKEKSIMLLKKQLVPHMSAQTRYEVTDQIFNDYLAFKSDSAMKYAELANSLAREIGNKECENESAIGMSACYATCGLFSQAKETLDNLDKSTFSQANYRMYYEYCRWLYITWGAFLHGSEDAVHFQKNVVAYNDSMITVVPHNDVDYYYWMGEHYWGHKQYDKAEEQYLLGIERMSPTSRRYASITCSLALMSRERGQWDKFEKYMILSAISDQKIPLKENMAMQELALYLSDKCDDMTRADKYLFYSLEDAIFYDNRLRLTEIARKFPDVVEKYQTNEAAFLHRQTVIIICTTILVLLLLILSWYGYHINRNLKAQRKIRIQLIEDMKKANDELHELSNELKDANDDLKETNVIREKYVSLFIELCAAYIDKYNQFHKSIERKAKAHQTDDLLTFLHQNRTKDVDTQEFFLNFDRAFLALYPDFVTQFNALLLPEQQCKMKKGELLSNELRIMALIRLGVNDTQKISTLLFYSTQTIYNYRSSMKQRSINPDTFEHDIMNCGVYYRSAPEAT